MRLVSWGRSPALMAVAALLAATVASLFWLAGAQPPPSTLHFERAAVLQQPAAEPALPPRVLDDRVLAGPWQMQALPYYAVKRTLVPGRDQAHGSPYTITWLRLDLPPSHPVQAADPHQVRLYLPRWQAIGQIAIYGDNQLLHQASGGPIWAAYHEPVWLHLVQGDAQALPRTVWIRLVSQNSTGAGISTVWVGESRDLVWRWRARLWMQTELPRIAGFTFLVIGLFSLGVWVARPGEPIYGWFFLAAAMFFVRRLTYSVLPEEVGLPLGALLWLNLMSGAAAALCVYSFAYRLHDKRFPRLERFLLACAALVSVVVTLMVMTDRWMFSAVSVFGSSFVVLNVIASAMALRAAWLSRARDAMLLTACIVGFVPLGIHDWALQQNLISVERFHLLPHLMILMHMLFLYLIYRRYADALRRVEGSREELQSRLAEREQELTASHAQLRLIEQRETLSRERQRITQDMHDGMGVSLNAALKMVERGAIDHQAVAQVLKECIDDLKLTIDAIELVETDLLALLGTLRFRIGKRLQAAGVHLAWAVQPVPPLPWLNSHSALHILRILQEVLNNIVRHAHADRITLGTEADGQSVRITVRDNGAGFAPGSVGEAGGSGVGNIRGRAQALGAQVGWEAHEGGTLFTLTLPL